MSADEYARELEALIVRELWPQIRQKPKQIPQRLSLALLTQATKVPALFKPHETRKTS